MRNNLYQEMAQIFSHVSFGSESATIGQAVETGYSVRKKLGSTNLPPQPDYHDHYFKTFFETWSVGMVVFIMNPDLEIGIHNGFLTSVFKKFTKYNVVILTFFWKVILLGKKLLNSDFEVLKKTLIFPVGFNIC